MGSPSAGRTGDRSGGRRAGNDVDARPWRRSTPRWGADTSHSGTEPDAGRATAGRTAWGSRRTASSPRRRRGARAGGPVRGHGTPDPEDDECLGDDHHGEGGERRHHDQHRLRRRSGSSARSGGRTAPRTSGPSRAAPASKCREHTGQRGQCAPRHSLAGGVSSRCGCEHGGGHPALLRRGASPPITLGATVRARQGRPSPVAGTSVPAAGCRLRAGLRSARATRRHRERRARRAARTTASASAPRALRRRRSRVGDVRHAGQASSMKSLHCIAPVMEASPFVRSTSARFGGARPARGRGRDRPGSTAAAGAGRCATPVAAQLVKRRAGVTSSRDSSASTRSSAPHGTTAVR